MRKVLQALRRGAIIGIVAAAIPAGTLRAEEVQLGIDNFTYTPKQLTVKAGTTVVWINHDDLPHTVTSKTGVFRSKALDTNDKFSFTFATPGTYLYFCALHPHMTGSIVVEAAAGK